MKRPVSQVPGQSVTEKGKGQGTVESVTEKGNVDRHQQKQEEKRKEKFTLFSDHTGSLLRRQPEARSRRSCTHQQQ